MKPTYVSYLNQEHGVYLYLGVGLVWTMHSLAICMETSKDHGSQPEEGEGGNGQVILETLDVC